MKEMLNLFMVSILFPHGFGGKYLVSDTNKKSTEHIQNVFSQMWKNIINSE